MDILLTRLVEHLDEYEATKKLNEAGFNYSEAAVRQKISRGRFDFAFALQICEVLDCKLEVVFKEL